MEMCLIIMLCAETGVGNLFPSEGHYLQHYLWAIQNYQLKN